MFVFLTIIFCFFSGILFIFSRGNYPFLEAVGIFCLCIALLIPMVFFGVRVASRLQKPLMKHISYSMLYGAALSYLCFITSLIWIRFDVMSQCLDAQREYGDDCVNALTRLLQDEERGFYARNDAIFALGQLGDRRAIPALETYYTGIIPAREPLDRGISQYELKKALRWCEEGNMTSWMYYPRF